MELYKNEKYWKNFVKNIIWLRKHYEFPKERMAEILGINVEMLNRIENGEMPEELNMEIIFKISNFFSLNPKELFSEHL
ncbi:MAG: helix-turn-helix transcriptional regulator [Clostridia bacterium]|nr:helix-turn-helix transcriptional regulator [Clostridia bacterium]